MKSRFEKRHVLAPLACLSLLYPQLSLAQENSDYFTGKVYTISFDSTSNNLYLLRDQMAFVETQSKILIPMRWSEATGRLCLQNSNEVTECWGGVMKATYQPVTLTSTCNAVSKWKQVNPLQAARSIAQLEMRQDVSARMKLASVRADRQPVLR